MACILATGHHVLGSATAEQLETKQKEMRIGQLEFRDLGAGRPAEIVHWFWSDTFSKEVCCTLLFYERGNEGYHIEFVGDRPFDHWGPDLWKLMKYGQDVLNARFELEGS